MAIGKAPFKWTGFSRGQTLIEATFGLLALVMVFSVCLRVAFYAAGREYLRFVSGEALVCLLEREDDIFCQNEAQLRLSSAMGWSRPWIALKGAHRKFKVANASFRPERPTGTVESLRQTLHKEEFLR